MLTTQRTDDSNDPPAPEHGERCGRCHRHRVKTACGDYGRNEFHLQVGTAGGTPPRLHRAQRERKKNNIYNCSCFQRHCSTNNIVV